MPSTFIRNIVDVIKVFSEYHFIFKMDEGDMVPVFMFDNTSSTVEQDF